MKERFYIHFDTKPSYDELKKVFSRCEEYEPVLTTSYLVSVDQSTLGVQFREIVRECFPHSKFVIAKVNRFYQYDECPYIKVTWSHQG